MELPNFVWQVGGEESGPNVVVMGGTHGDEIPGVRVIQSMLAQVGLLNTPSGTIVKGGWVRGNLFLALGNPEAILRNTRSASGVRDLNRSFVLDELSRSDIEFSMDQKRAKELLPLLSQADLLIDLHATSNPSVPFLCTSQASARHLELARLFPVKYMITDPDNVLGEDMGLPVTATTDYCINTSGGIGICYESGKSDDVTQVAGMSQTVCRVLAHFGAIAADAPLGEDVGDTKEYQVECYRLTHSVTADETEFAYVPGMEDNWQLLEEGLLVGHFPSGKEVRTPARGMYLFPRRADLVREGFNLFYMAQPL